jgi:type I protein arginine methyltransferase
MRAAGPGSRLILRMTIPPSIASDRYRVADYGAMIGDRVRAEAYAAALRQSVREDSVVLDIGTGAGTFALFACQLGARRVVAVEPDDVIELARELAVINGCQDRIEFIQDVSTNVTLAERADVIVSDLRGAFPLYRQHIPSIVDARKRLLAAGGTLMPQRDRIWATILTDPVQYRRYLESWREWPGLDMDAARNYVANTPLSTRPKPDQFLADPQRWATLDYRTIEDPNLTGRLEWRVSRAGPGHGVDLWFDATLGEGISYSAMPWHSDSVYPGLFLPFPEPLTLAEGDTVSVDLQASLIGGDYVWRWETRAWAQGDEASEIASFAQSTVHGVLPAQLRRVTATHEPTLNEEGRLGALVLSRMSDRVALEQIAQEAQVQFPARFETLDEALDYVAELSFRYSK